MNSISIFLALMIPGTFFLGLNDVLVRKVLGRSRVNEQALLAFDTIGTSVILGVPLLISGIPVIKPGFWSALAVTAVLNIFAQWAWYAGFKREEASIISPLRLLTPPLVILTGFFVLGEKPSLLGLVGIAITVFGLWELMRGETMNTRTSWFAVMRRPGVLLGLWGAFSFALSFPFDKKIVVASSPLFAVTIAFFIVGLANGLIGFALQGKKRFFDGLRDQWTTIAILPFVHGLAALMSYAALPYALAAYAASVKRLWSFWAVILSGSFLKERNFNKRIFATVLMFTGILVTLFLG